VRRAKDVLPYLVPTEEAITAGTWLLLRDGEKAPLPDHLPFWDYQMDLVLERQVSVDLDLVCEQSGLSRDVGLLVVVEWFTSSGQWSGLACRAPVAVDGDVVLSTKLKGENLGGRLTLTTRLILAEDADQRPPFIASRAGEILYEDWWQVQLQSDSGRLPISVIDFAAGELDPKARWWLDVHSDPAAPYAGGMRLYLNSNDTELIQAAVRAGSPTPTQKRLLEWLHMDVARQLVERTLQQDWATTRSEYEDDPDSLGSALLSQVGLLFPGLTLDEVRSLKDHDPGRFAARLQAALLRTMQLEK
jgi:hypothetical protein